MPRAIKTAMTGFTKLFGTLVSSTIWREDNTTRVVWITMLAMADRNGNVQASVPGLAAFANVSLDECVSALKKLTEPDPWSRTKYKEGRRIVEIDGGWNIVNYIKYRELGREVDRTAYMREKQREYRQRVSSDSVDSVGNHTLSTPVNKSLTVPYISASASESASESASATASEQKQIKRGFASPSLDECKTAFIESGSTAEQGEAFFNFYESNGWKVGKNQMKSWRHAAAGWIARNKTGVYGHYGHKQSVGGVSESRNRAMGLDASATARKANECAEAVARMQVRLRQRSGMDQKVADTGHDASPGPSDG